MATNLDIVTRAFRKIRVSGSGDPLNAEEAADGMSELNDMLQEWALRGVDLSYTDGDLTDTFPLADEYRAGTVHMLAMRMSPDYARPREFDADDFFRAIQAAYMTIDEVTFEDGLIDLPSGYRGYI